MWTNQPTLQFVQQIRASGEFSVEPEPLQVDELAVKRTLYESESLLTFSARLSSSCEEYLSNVMDQRLVRFSGEFQRIWSVSADAMPLSRGELTVSGEVEKLDIWHGQPHGNPEQQTILVSFTPTELAQPERTGLVRHWTGERYPLNDKGYNEPFDISTEVGKGGFSQYARYENAFVGSTEATVEIPVPTLEIDVSENNTTDCVSELIDQLQPQLQTFSVLLSFLSRRQVRWSEIRVVSEQSGETRDRVHEYRRMRTALGSKGANDALLVPVRLDKTSLDDLFRELENCKYRESITNAVNHLNAYWKEATVEEHLTHVFTAFESLVNGISSEDGTAKTIHEREFRVLRRALEDEIKEQSSSLDISSDMRSELYSKLAELQRAPVYKTAIKVLDRFGVSDCDPWNGEDSLERSIQSAYARRNDLIHQGRVKSLDEAVVDCECMHKVSERLISSILGVERRWLHPFAYSGVRVVTD